MELLQLEKEIAHHNSRVDYRYRYRTYHPLKSKQVSNRFKIIQQRIKDKKRVRKLNHQNRLRKMAYQQNLVSMGISEHNIEYDKPIELDYVKTELENLFD